MMIRIKFIIASLLAMFFCSIACAGPKNVLVVINNNSADSTAVGKYYAAKRDIGSKYICKISCPTSEIIKDEAL